MATTEKTARELLQDLRGRRWSDAAIGRELGITGVSVWRWRTGECGIKMERIVRMALLELLSRP